MHRLAERNVPARERRYKIAEQEISIRLHLLAHALSRVQNMPHLSKTKHVNSTGSRGASCDEEVTEVPRLVGSAPEGLTGNSGENRRRGISLGGSGCDK